LVALYGSRGAKNLGQWCRLFVGASTIKHNASLDVVIGHNLVVLGQTVWHSLESYKFRSIIAPPPPALGWGHASLHMCYHAEIGRFRSNSIRAYVRRYAEKWAHRVPIFTARRYA